VCGGGQMYVLVWKIKNALQLQVLVRFRDQFIGHWIPKTPCVGVSPVCESFGFSFFFKFNVRGSVHRKYIQQDATLHRLYLETALHVSGGTSTPHQERIYLYLQHRYLSHRYCYLPLSWSWNCSNSSTIAAGSSNGVTNTRCCKCSCMRSWWWAEVPPETCRAVSRYK